MRLQVLLAFTLLGVLSQLVDAFKKYPHCETLTFTKPFLYMKASRGRGLQKGKSPILMKAAVPMSTLAMTFPTRLTSIAQSSMSGAYIRQQYDLRLMNTEASEVLYLLKQLAPLISTCKDPLNAQDVGNIV